MEFAVRSYCTNERGMRDSARVSRPALYRWERDLEKRCGSFGPVSAASV